MGAGLLPLFYVSAGAVLLEILLPGEGREGARGALHIMVVLVLLLLMVNPFLEFIRVGGVETVFGELTGESDESVRETYEKTLGEVLSEGSVREIRQRIEALLATEYGIEEGQAQVSVRVNEEGEVVRVEIYLSGAALLKNPRELQAALSETLGVETEVR